MKYNIQQVKDAVVIKDVQDFELPHIFECGQCFRWWREDDGSYTMTAKGKVINLCRRENSLIIHPTTLEEFHQVWYSYFDMDRDYGTIKKVLSENDPVMEKATAFGHGIRILRQDPWETLISFIISSNRGISMIQKSIEDLSLRYGTYIGEYRGRKYYDFPKPQALLNQTVEAIRLSKTGYRAKYIVDAAAVAAENQIELYQVHNLSTENARKTLLRISGVGPKVADCILLFSMDKQDAFPIDTWVKRVMEFFYVPQGIPLNQLQDYAGKRFGAYAGFAQQYLFYYARELGIGKGGQGRNF
ncbi:DNA-3-methyladenine glycosylase family protein [Geosporobacter ferrireducens]|uniref:DNA-3-methyladenine glycosylase family protein n=1 Tax=Geosporobacter ferrireducens TaxID=1424294 RepID=UPI00139BE1B4|nr:DNA glycosylase [Geosporobacter ferrireducens]MTI58349.1 8-oxoguanine DNA glycosylase [Geosporobacter ferrireducens]